eukprot:SM000032S12066  [mRNA]  locus=s32:323842:327845:+ [translate_table: standard]
MQDSWHVLERWPYGALTVRRLVYLDVLPAGERHSRAPRPGVKAGRRCLPVWPALGWGCAIRPEAMISTEEALALVAHLPGLLHPPKLKRHWRRLAYDLLCLCSGMRATVMLDYMCIHPSQLAAVLANLFQRIRVSSSLGVMYMGGCSYVYHEKNLLSTGQATLDGLHFTTNFIILTAEGAKFAGPEQHKFIHEQLVHFLAHMSSLLNDMPAQGGVAGQYLDLEGYCQEGQLPLPTLNGWLLGYPVVYYFRKQQQNAVTGLSHVNLLQLKLMLPSKLLSSGPVLSKNHAESTDLDVLLRTRALYLHEADRDSCVNNGRGSARLEPNCSKCAAQSATSFPAKVGLRGKRRTKT